MGELGRFSIVRISFLVFTVIFAQAAANAQADQPPAAPREFRAAWVATVENIDWPSKRGLSTAEQQAEIDQILNVAADLNLNAIVLQVRTTADALYASELEPWSIYLSGKQGVAPKPYYDPLEYWVTAAHARGIELHAWFNPYRAQMTPGELADSHISRTMPDSVKQYDRYLWMDPGSKQAQEHSLAVFNDVVRRYDIDGVHIDDYFYPYPVTKDGAKVPFPDDVSWAEYQAAGGKLERDDWRRQNINDLIEKIYETTHAIKPHVRFGISPFGIGRAGKAPGISGFDQYHELYADAALWLRQGWCDYFTPQLYWPIAQKAQSFPVLLDYWHTENTQSRFIWPGLYTSRVGNKTKGYDVQEVADQIEAVRGRSAAPGHVHFSMKALLENREGLVDTLKAGVYRAPALAPAMTWLDDSPPAPPQVEAERSTGGKRTLKLSAGDDEAVWLWSLWTRSGDNWIFTTHPGQASTIDIDAATSEWVLAAVDRCGNESSRVRSTD